LDTHDEAKEEEGSKTARMELICEWMMTHALAHDQLSHPIHRHAENLVREGLLLADADGRTCQSFPFPLDEAIAKENVST